MVAGFGYTSIPGSDPGAATRDEPDDFKDPASTFKDRHSQTFHSSALPSIPPHTSPLLQASNFLRRRSSHQSHLPHTSLHILSNFVNVGRTTTPPPWTRETLHSLSPRRPLRIFLLINTLLLFAILLGSTQREHLSKVHLPSVNLKAVASHFPFNKASPPATCDTCRLDPTDPLCMYGRDNIQLSRMYEGSGHRVRRVIEKALRGERISIGIIGASVTAGHGVPHNEPKWHEVFTNDWLNFFPNTTIYDGSYPGMNSEFYSYCFEEKVPPTSDLYLVELDINNHKWALRDLIVAQSWLLQLPQRPAVVRINVFAMLFEDLQGGTPSALTMSSYFDIPMIGYTYRLKNFMLPHILLHPNLAGEFFHDDGWGATTRHINYIAHRVLGDMVALYFREQICDMRDRLAHPTLPHDPQWPGDEILDSVPDQFLWTKWLPDTHVHTMRHSCALVDAKWHNLTPLPSTSPSWEVARWNGKAAVASFEVGSQIVIPFKGVTIGVFVWTTNGVNNVVKPGRAACWIDGMREGSIVLDAYWNGDTSFSYWHLLSEDLVEGDHTLTCEILSESSTEGHDFRILGIGSQ
ncbi:hypothetical protein P7C70_g3849, partial [Phenoliferia sp. Uapishka_3]